MDQHSDRWIKVDDQATKDFLADDDQEPFKQIEVIQCEGIRICTARRTQEAGVQAVTFQAIKVGVTNNLQGSPGGAWLQDAVDRAEKMVNQVMVAEKIFDCLRKAECTIKDDLQTGRV